MNAAQAFEIAVGDVVEVPWELEELRGVVRRIDAPLGHVTVEVRPGGQPERFSVPLSVVTPVSRERDLPPSEAAMRAGALDEPYVLAAVLEGVGAGRRVTVNLTPTTDDDGQPLLFVDVTLLDVGDQQLSPEELLDLQTSVRNHVFEAVDETAIVIAQVLPRAASAA